MNERKKPKALAEYAVERRARRQELINDKIKSAEDQLDEMAKGITKVVLKHPFLENAPADLVDLLSGMRASMVKASSNLELAKRLLQQGE